MKYTNVETVTNPFLIRDNKLEITIVIKITKRNMVRKQTY